MLPTLHNQHYPVYEHFLSFQGEGSWAGRCAWFIRLYGCDQKCHFCDSAGTWHNSWRPKEVVRYTVQELMDMIPDAPFEFMVLTGGEPTLYNLKPVTSAFSEKTGKPVHIETAGHCPVRTDNVWITISPKPFAKPPLHENVQRADEFKIIVESDSSIDAALDVLQGRRPDAPVYLHPEWSKRHDVRIQSLIVNWVKRYGYPFRAGLQSHKYYNADFYDRNSDKTVIPLGGVE